MTERDIETFINIARKATGSERTRLIEYLSNIRGSESALLGENHEALSGRDYDAGEEITAGCATCAKRIEEIRELRHLVYWQTARRRVDEATRAARVKIFT